MSRRRLSRHLEIGTPSQVSRPSTSFAASNWGVLALGLPPTCPGDPGGLISAAHHSSKSCTRGETLRAKGSERGTSANRPPISVQGLDKSRPNAWCPAATALLPPTTAPDHPHSHSTPHQGRHAGANSTLDSFSCIVQHAGEDGRREADRLNWVCCSPPSTLRVHRRQRHRVLFSFSAAVIQVPYFRIQRA